MIGHLLHRSRRSTQFDPTGRTIKRIREEFEGVVGEYVDLTREAPLRRSDRRGALLRPPTPDPAPAPPVADNDDDDLVLLGSSEGGGLYQERDLRPPGLREASDPVAWRRAWHRDNPGKRMCPGARCGNVINPLYVTGYTRSGAPQFTCNSMSCRECGVEFCLTCGQEKGQGRASGYHRACGRQPPWLTNSMTHISNNDPRVQQPPPLHP
jgi:hypothetical protein